MMQSSPVSVTMRENIIIRSSSLKIAFGDGVYNI